MAKYAARGNVPTGKVQRAFYLSTELADELRIEAAKQNESQSSIVEKALRRELGMMAEAHPYEGYEIHYNILGGNILTDSGDDNGTYDEAASIAKYAETCEVALREAFPGASVHVGYELNVSGGDGSELYVIDTNDGMRHEPGHNSDGERLADEALDVTNRVWESWGWVVYDVATPR